jgi:hypothetical protein
MRSMSELADGKVMGHVVVGALGPVIFLIAGYLLSRSAVNQFATRYSRQDHRRPEQPVAVANLFTP